MRRPKPPLPMRPCSSSLSSSTPLRQMRRQVNWLPRRVLRVQWQWPTARMPLSRQRLRP